MRVTTTIRALVLAAGALAGGAASAAGAYDAIYNVPDTPLYISVHQNGNHVIAGHFYTVSSQELGLSGQGFPPNINLWDVYGGDISGNTVTVSGQAVLGSCNISHKLVFDSTGVTMTIVAASNTAYGNQIGVNCGTLANGATPVRANRVF